MNGQNNLLEMLDKTSHPSTPVMGSGKVRKYSFNKQAKVWEVNVE
jgi:hypothetical protein